MINPLHQAAKPTRLPSASDQQTDRVAAVERVVGLLRARRPPAALAMELAALISRDRNGAPVDLDACLGQLEAETSVLIEQHAAPDVHLETCDLRVVALVPQDSPAEQAAEAARTAAAAVWDEWLRQFLATHRCT
jgi:hypothetical protein